MLRAKSRANQPSDRRLLLACFVLLIVLSLWCSSAPPTVASTALWSPPAKRVGLQVGHLRIEELPEDQARLRGQTGGSGGGFREVDINLAVVERVALLLTARGVLVDILPAAVPTGYTADLFLTVHCDASLDLSVTGFKLARYRASARPQHDDALIAVLTARYGEATGLRWDNNITRAMSGYYAYNQRLYRSVIAPQTPAVIIELGFLTNPGDRALLVGGQEVIAAALAEGILEYLALAPSLGARQFAGTGWPTP